MCGILGVIEVGDRGGRWTVPRASSVLAHRGPDDAADWSSQCGMVHVSLGHRRLSIIDLSRAGAQPVIMNEDRSLCAVHAAGDAALVMVYNGEIYNYVELRKELRNLGHRFTSEGDSQVLLAAYAQWGEECLARLNGMFAFAIWDEARRQLFCARDRFGEKPLYYTTDPRRERFAFASEVKALVALGTMSPEPNLRAVYRYFRFGEQAGVPDTVWENVWKLLPGTCLTVKTDRAELVPRLRRYWDVSVADDTSVSTRSAAERFAELFQDSVRIRLRSDVPVGTSL